MQEIYNSFLAAWYRYPLLFIPLWPISILYKIIVYLRRFAYEKGLFTRIKIAVPVIVVGNLVVGGTGKTPTVIALVQLLQKQGFKPGVITRGFGGACDNKIMEVTAYSDAKIVGDEALLIAQQTQCPVFINKNRVKAAQALTSRCDVIISDDGLQHYALSADIKIAMQADPKWLHNPFCLPAGPWREPQSRLKQVDFVLQLQTEVEGVYLLNDSEKKIQSIQIFKDKTVHAVCAIAAPWRFFDLLNQFEIEVKAHAHKDHQLLSENDFNVAGDYPIVITEKDAVKCLHMHLPRVWVVKIKAKLDPSFTTALLNKLSGLRK